jgi:hypothetical protein
MEAQVTSQQLGDLALEEHRAVMAALIKNEIRRPTEDQYMEQLRCVHAIFSERPIFYSDLPQHLSEAL